MDRTSSEPICLTERVYPARLGFDRVGGFVDDCCTEAIRTLGERLTLAPDATLDSVVDLLRNDPLALERVPTDFCRDLVTALPERFKTETMDVTGVSKIECYTDQLTDRTFFLKIGSWNRHEALAEVMSANVVSAAGFPIGLVRLASTPQPNDARWVLIEHMKHSFEPDTTIKHRSIREQRKNVEIETLVGLAIVDSALNNVDRHDQNVLFASVDGAGFALPIDQSLADAGSVRALSPMSPYMMFSMGALTGPMVADPVERAEVHQRARETLKAIQQIRWNPITQVVLRTETLRPYECAYVRDFADHVRQSAHGLDHKLEQLTNRILDGDSGRY